MSEHDLSPENRLRLVQLACVAAWADADLAPQERRFVLGLCRALGLDDEDTLLRVQQWLAHGPPDLDPQQIPRAHREVFIDVTREVIAADGRIDPEESELLELLQQLLS